MTTEIEVHKRLPDLIEKAAASLASATTAGEVLEARDQAALAYDAAKAAARFARLREAHATVLSACHQAQADALKIEARAQCRLADEYDAAKKRGEIAQPFGGDHFKGNQYVVGVTTETLTKPNARDLGFDQNQIHDARQIRDAEKRQPGIVEKTLDEMLDAGEEPTRADVKRAVKKTNKPKGGPQPQRHKNAPIDEEVAASLVLDRGKSYEQAATETGVGSVQIIKTAVAKEIGRREAKADPEIDPSTLSLSAQQKLEAAIRQEKRRLANEFERRVQDECRKAIEATILPSYNESYAEYRAVTKARKGIMTKATYNKIIRCLHPDSRKSVTDETLSEAFRLFSKLELLLLDEKESPTATFQMPKTYEELMALKAKVSAERKAKRGHQNMTRK